MTRTGSIEHVNGFEAVATAFGSVPVDRYCGIAGVEPLQLRQTAELLRDASSVSFMEDLGIQMNRHSTLVSYLNRLMWVLTGSFGRRGTMNVFNPLAPLGVQTGSTPACSPVKEAKVITGLVPCNVIPEEILTDHPDRYRAMIVESANPGSLPGRHACLASGHGKAGPHRYHRCGHDRDSQAVGLCSS